LIHLHTGVNNNNQNCCRSTTTINNNRFCVCGNDRAITIIELRHSKKESPKIQQ
jgi:hypothetical protein